MKYIINHEVNGYKTLGIEDSETILSPDNSVVIVLDESTNGANGLLEYYEAVTKMIINRVKVYIIIVGTESNIRNAICNLCANYRNYNLYKVDSKLTISEEYIDEILDREPTIDEVQAFIGGDISGYADLNIIVAGIEDLCRRGELDGLKNFVERHIKSIENFTSISDYMKKIVDTSNSKELLSRLDELKLKVKEAESKLDKSESTVKSLTEVNQSLMTANEANKAELSKLMSSNKELEQQVSSRAPVIQTYSEINTSVNKCKVPSIIYFKEVSYIPYVNSMVSALMDIMNVFSKKAKLLIYDSRVGLANLYKPLSIVDSQEFFNNKSNYVQVVNKFVVAEPNQSILQSVIENYYDVLIIYDRMRQPTPLISGNNVTNFYIINSNKEYNAVRQQLKILDPSYVITRENSSIGQSTLNIPTLDDYSIATDTAKVNKYMKLQSSGNNKPLIDTILKAARVQLKK